MDSYLNSSMRQHHLEKESSESRDKMNHNDFYLLNGWERKHLAFGSASIHALLTANPTRKYLPPSGKLDRRSMIVLVLLLAGDIHLNPGPVQTRSHSCRLEELASQLASQLASLPLQQQLRDDNRDHGDSGDRGINGDFDIPPGTPRQTDTHEAVTRGREPRSEGTNIHHAVSHPASISTAKATTEPPSPHHPTAPSTTAGRKPFAVTDKDKYLQADDIMHLNNKNGLHIFHLNTNSLRHKLAELRQLFMNAPGVASKPVQSSSMWSSLLSHLRSSVTVKRRRVHLKSHSDCFLGSEAVDVLTEHISCGKAFEGADVTRDKVVCVCQALLDCNVFEAVGTKVFGKDKKQDVFQDSKSALYRFVVVCFPSVDELEKGVLVKGIQRLFCSAPTDRQEEQTCPSGLHVQFSTPVKCTQTFLQAEQHLSPAAGSLSLGPQMDSLTPCRLHNDTALPQSLVDEIWQEQTLLRLLNLVELPLLSGVLQWCQNPAPPSPSNLLPCSNPNLIYSSNHLDRQILRAFRDSQEDEWLGAALDCLDFLPDQPVVELSRELPLCEPQHQDSSEHGGGSSSDEQPRLSLSGVAQCKLLLYGTLVKHYSHTDRPPLMPPHMTDIYTAITDLLVNAKLNMALEALQLCLKLLPPGCRDQLRKVLTFMALAADPQGIKLDKEMENRQAVKRSFFRAMLHSRVLSKDKEDLMVVFMLTNIKEMFKIPGALHNVVSEKLAGLVQGEQPDVTSFTFCQQVSRRIHADSTKETTNQALWTLLNSIYQDPKVSAKEKKRLLGQFYQAHPEIFNKYFGESAVNVL